MLKNIIKSMINEGSRKNFLVGCKRVEKKLKTLYSNAKKSMGNFENTYGNDAEKIKKDIIDTLKKYEVCIDDKLSKLEQDINDESLPTSWRKETQERYDKILKALEKIDKLPNTKIGLEFLNVLANILRSLEILSKKGI